MNPLAWYIIPSILHCVSVTTFLLDRIFYICHCMYIWDREMQFGIISLCYNNDRCTLAIRGHGRYSSCNLVLRILHQDSEQNKHVLSRRNPDDVYDVHAIWFRWLSKELIASICIIFGYIMWGCVSLFQSKRINRIMERKMKPTCHTKTDIFWSWATAISAELCRLIDM